MTIKHCISMLLQMISSLTMTLNLMIMSWAEVVVQDASKKSWWRTAPYSLVAWLCKVSGNFQWGSVLSTLLTFELFAWKTQVLNIEGPNLPSMVEFWNLITTTSGFFGHSNMRTWKFWFKGNWVKRWFFFFFGQQETV